MTDDDYIGVVSIWGEEGTCKSSMALTFPKRVAHFDIDVGGYRRAYANYKEGTSSKSYPKPIQMDKLVGQQVTQASNGQAMTIRTPKKVEGVRELWQTIAQDFVNACMDSDISTIIIDTATLLWNIVHNSILQEAQERQIAKGIGPEHEKFRERLQPIEYGPANDRMRTLIHTARTYNKNLVLVHYPTDEYGTIPDARGNMVEGKTGRKIPDGFKETGKLADLVLYTRINEQRVGNTTKVYPMARIVKCGIQGMGIDAVGKEISASFEGIISLRNMMRGDASA